VEVLLVSQPSQPGREPTRRDFARTLIVTAAASAAAATAAPVAVADDPPKPKLEGVPGVGQALADAVRLRYGKHLNDDQLAAVQRGVTNSLLSADRLAKLTLKNSDEPAVIFHSDLP
jgi:hypothetical protein